MKSIIVPLEFFKAIGEKSHTIRIIWIKWLADYPTELLRPDFVEFFHNDMKGSNLSLETIKEAYEFGVAFFKDGFIIQETSKKTKKVYPKELTEQAEKVLYYLNSVAGTTYTTSKANLECIVARINEGYSYTDFKIVVDNKCGQWLGTEQEKYIRPITLFQAKKFENYLNEPKYHKNNVQQPRNTGSIQKLSNASEKAKRLFD